MKNKILIAIMAVMLCGTAAGQSDTVIAPYFQFDWQNWINSDPHHPLTTTANSLMARLGSPQRFDYESMRVLVGDLVQYNYIEGGAVVYGIAVWAQPNPAGYYYSDSLPLFPAEYLYLYEATPDTFMLMGTLPFNNLDSFTVESNWPVRFRETSDHTAYCSDTMVHNDGCNLRKWEFYFDKPIHVEDSFYVGGSWAGGFPAYAYLRINDPLGEFPPPCLLRGYGWMVTENTGVFGSSTWYDPTCWAPAMKSKHRWRPYPGLESYFSAEEGYTLGEWIPREEHSFYMIVPILKTYDTIVGDDPPDPPECSFVTRFYMMSHFNDSIVLRWQGDGVHDEWELSYGRLGTEPDSGTIVTCHDTRWTYIDTLHNGDTMSAWVRTVCREMDTLRYSEWSRPVTWHGERMGIEVPEGGTVDGFVHVMPNPASDEVTVISSYGLKGIEVYTSRGELYRSIEARSLSGGFTVQDWPKGVYVVLVRTEAGATAKKLLVR